MAAAPSRRTPAAAAISKNKRNFRDCGFNFIFCLFTAAKDKSPRGVKFAKSHAKSLAKPAAKSSKSRRVPAAKTTVRAPKVQQSKEEEIEDDISIESDEKVVEEVQAPLVRGVKVLRVSKRQPVKKPVVVTEIKAATENADEFAISPAKKTSKKKAKKAAEKGAKKTTRKVPAKPRTPVKKSPGRPPRVVHTFNGAPRLALKARQMFTDPNVPVEDRPQAIVIEKAIFEQGKAKRTRSSWSAAEIEDLTKGVEKHGEGSWSAILHDRNLVFIRGERSQVDLKDKWRNLKAYVPYSEHPIRKFILVDSKHQPMYTTASNLHIFSNRWPRDAAMKVATRDSTYPLNADGMPLDSAIVHLKEELDEQGKLERHAIVHVYRVTRVLERPKSIKKFEGYAAVWVAKVDKIAEEILIKSSEVMEI